jgi:phenylacetyl-CoA:acceptor oxidoreductase subunit 1
MPKWGMVIDLQKCINCKACEVACTQTNNVPRESRRNVFDFGQDQIKDEIRISLPMSCMQCEAAPCLDVCPTKATYQRNDGIVDIDPDLCIGCGYCIVGCPYNTRSIIQEEISGEDDDLIADNGIDSFLGTCTKCNFCVEKVDSGIKQGLSPGIDQEATPSCVNMCSSKALYFGDLQDPDSNVSKLVKEENVECLHPEVGTKPSLYYVVPEDYTLNDSKE